MEVDCCPHCGGTHLVRKGTAKRTGKQVRRCGACERYSTEGVAPPEALPPVAADVYCHHCGSGQVRYAGRERNGKRRYKCRACGRYCAEGAAPARPSVEAACRHCGSERVVRGGRCADGRQILLCRACGRSSRPPILSPRPRSRARRYTYQISLNLNRWALASLDRYAKWRGVTRAEAVREVFRRVGEFRSASGGRRISADPEDPSLWKLPRPKPPAPVVEAPLPPHLGDMRPSANRKRMAITGTTLRPSVIVVARVAVRLDASALRGLCIYMERTGLTHQEAARRALDGLRTGEDVIAASAGRRLSARI